MLISDWSSSISHDLIHLRSILVLMDVKIYSRRHDDYLLVTLWLLFLVWIIDLLNLSLPYVLDLRNIFLAINIDNFTRRNNFMFPFHDFRLQFLIKSFHNLRRKFIRRPFLTHHSLFSWLFTNEIIKLRFSILIESFWRIKIRSMRFISRVIWRYILVWL